MAAGNPRRAALRLIFAGGLWALAAGPVPAAEPDWASRREESWRIVWSTVNEVYFDPTFGGVDWTAVGERYRARLDGAAEPAALRSLLQAMLGELGRTHFQIVPREAAVFSPAERDRVGVLGVTLAADGDKVRVAAIAADSPAAAAGLPPGTEVQEIDGVRLAGVRDELAAAGFDATRAMRQLLALAGARLQAPVGTTVRIAGVTPTGERWQSELACAPHRGEWAEPIGNYPSLPLEWETRSADGIAYLRLSVFAPAAMRPLRTFLRGLKAGDGLIIDLRGNPGGITAMAPGLAGWLMDRETSLGSVRLRRGGMGYPVYPQEGAFLGPVAVLIDGGSASTSEILAAGLRDLGRARLFGERSAGAALPSLFKTLPNGDLFQYAIGDIRSPRGQSLEGTGVAPDEAVGRTAADLASGVDAPLAAATAWLRSRSGNENRESKRGGGSGS